MENQIEFNECKTAKSQAENDWKYQSIGKFILYLHKIQPLKDNIKKSSEHEHKN